MNANLDQAAIDLEALTSYLTDEEYSAYGIHTVLNKILVANGADKIRPQMMYNYARNGMIVKGEKIFGVTLRNFSAAEVAQFLLRYAAKKGLEIKFEATETNPDQLELELEI